MPYAKCPECHTLIHLNVNDVAAWYQERWPEHQVGEVVPLLCPRCWRAQEQKASGLTPLQRAERSLAGLSVGDAFGELFFQPDDVVDAWLTTRTPPPAPWPYTDDTEMACSVLAVLRRYGSIDQVALAASFAAHYDGSRGYGPSMHRVLMRIRDGEAWQHVTHSAFGGMGSWGNGAAMRSGLVGAYFADSLPAVVEQARLAAEVTHAHPEAIAGAIAVAVAAAVACRVPTSGVPTTGATFLHEIIPHVPASSVAEKLQQAQRFAANSSVRFAVAVLGNGTALSAPDTVPFALWCASQALYSYEDALWLTVSGGGDRDTTCAIVGSIVSLVQAGSGIPNAWLQAREALPGWAR